MTKGLHRLLVLLQSGSEMATFIKKKYETQLAIPHVCLLLLHMEHNCFCLASSVTWKQTFVFFFVTWKHNCFFLASSVTWKHNLHSHALLASPAKTRDKSQYRTQHVTETYQIHTTHDKSQCNYFTHLNIIN